MGFARRRRLPIPCKFIHGQPVKMDHLRHYHRHCGERLILFCQPERKKRPKPRKVSPVSKYKDIKEWDHLPAQIWLSCFYRKMVGNPYHHLLPQTGKVRSLTSTVENGYTYIILQTIPAPFSKGEVLSFARNTQYAIRNMLFTICKRKYALNPHLKLTAAHTYKNVILSKTR